MTTTYRELTAIETQITEARMQGVCEIDFVVQNLSWWRKWSKGDIISAEQYIYGRGPLLNDLTDTGYYQFSFVLLVALFLLHQKQTLQEDLPESFLRRALCAYHCTNAYAKHYQLTPERFSLVCKILSFARNSIYFNYTER